MVLTTALIATSAMTIFSYIVSGSFNKLYKEPVLLQYVFCRLGLTPRKSVITAIAWLVHYAVGWLFVAGFAWSMRILSFAANWKSGLVFGTVIGLIGIAGWAVMFRLGRPAETDKSGYYAQLFIAHHIFACATIWMFKLLG